MRPIRALALAGLAALVAVCGAVSLAGSPVSAAVTPGVEPDIVLSHSSRTFFDEYTTLLVNDLSPQADPSVVPTPDQCRTPAFDQLCDVFRIKIVRDKSLGATNFVQLLFAWPSQVQTPALALAVAGLSDSDQPDIDLFLYENATTYVDYELVGGRGAIVPERIVWEATQDEYDLVVRSGTGVVTEYSVAGLLANEAFARPFEVLENVAGQAPTERPGDLSEVTTAPPSGAGLLPPLAVAPVGIDEQIAGIGLGTTEQFDLEEALQLGRDAIRNTSVSTEPPSALALVLAMIAMPAGAALVAVLVLRRRRSAFVS